MRPMNLGGVEFQFRSLEPDEAPLDPEQFERELYAQLEQEYPSVWRACYPRIYRDPRNGQYYSSKKPARQLMLIALKILNNQIGESEKYEYHLASHLAKYRVPMYWLSPSIAQALKLTTPPGKFDWYDMPLPFDAGVFMMPKGSLVHKTDGDVTFLTYARFRAGVTHSSPLIPGKTYTNRNGGMILAAAVQKGYFIHWNIPLDYYGSVIALPELQDLIRHHNTEHGSAVHTGDRMTSDDFDLGMDAAHYIFSTLLLMTARPDLVTAASFTNRVPGKRGAQPREFWSPAVIGEHYRTRTEARPAQGGTHASPRFHWVKGAWKEQPYGPKLTLRRTQWVEPYTRGGNE